MANIKHALILCDGTAPPTDTDGVPVHWKTIIPKLKSTEIIRDFQLIAEQGAKKLFYCLLEKNEQWPRVVQWIQDNPLEGIEWWVGNTPDEMWKKLWQDNRAVAIRVLKYKVQTTDEEGNAVNRLVTVKEAEDTFGVTIDPKLIKPPIQCYGV